MKIEIRTLIPTQNDIRSYKVLSDLIKSNLIEDILVKEPVELTRIGDKIYVHNGHHRLTATRWHCLEYLEPNQYVIFDRSFEDYMIPNFPLFCTPFDPRTTVRKPEFYEFKRTVQTMFALHGRQGAQTFIDNNREQYSEPRLFENFGKFSSAILSNSNSV